jgi:hypothetical protein
MESACGVLMTASAAAETRPSTAAGVTRCIRVLNATIT